MYCVWHENKELNVNPWEPSILPNNGWGSESMYRPRGGGALLPQPRLRKRPENKDLYHCKSNMPSYKWRVTWNHFYNFPLRFFHPVYTVQITSIQSWELLLKTASKRYWEKSFISGSKTTHQIQEFVYCKKSLKILKMQKGTFTLTNPVTYCCNKYGNFIRK